MKRAILLAITLAGCAATHRPVAPRPAVALKSPHIVVLAPGPRLAIDGALRPAHAACRPPEAPALPDTAVAPDLATAIDRLTVRDKLRAEYERRLLVTLKACSR